MMTDWGAFWAGVAIAVGLVFVSCAIEKLADAVKSLRRSETNKVDPRGGGGCS